MYKEKALEFLGITEWHKQGYTGKGIKIMSDEYVVEQAGVIAPAGFHKRKEHGDIVMDHIKLVAPDAELISYPMSGSFGSNYESKCVDYIIKNKVDVFTTSQLGGYPNEGKQKAIQDCIKAGCIFFAAAGNNNERGVQAESSYDGYYAIGGVMPKSRYGVYDWNDLQKVRYSSVGKELDFVTLAEILGTGGTSFCSPIFAGMVGLVQQFFYEKTGKKLDRMGMFKFIKDNLIDTISKGFDEESGHGLFKLPKPQDIDIPKYIDYGGFPIMNQKTKIVLDAGHGKETLGKRSPDESLLEYEFNRAVASKIKPILERHGLKVILTCEDDTDISLEDRCNIANDNNADYFISIHANAFGGESWNDANGWEIYVISKGGKAEELAESIRKESLSLGLKDRGVKEANFYVLRNTDMPSVLIEHGFYTNYNECQLLKTDNFRQKCAESDAKGILSFLGISYIPLDAKPEIKGNTLELTIDKKEYTINGETKVSDVAPKIENSRTLVPIYLLKELGLKVEWNADERKVIVHG